MSKPRWLTTQEFAAIAGIGARSAKAALLRASEGRTWRGRELTVRRVRGKQGGGASGWAYEVLASCLDDPDAQEAAPQTSTDVQAQYGSPARREAGERMMARYDLIRPVLHCPGGSPERAMAVEIAAYKAGRDESTIYDWIAAHERDGIGGLMRKGRSDRGKGRVLIGRACDTAMRALPDDLARELLTEKLRTFVRSAWASNTEQGWKWIARRANYEFAELMRAEGIEIDRAARKVPRNFVMAERKFRAVAIYDQDAKQWHDKHMPRIQRTRTGRAPMEVVIADVHPMDVLLPRADGSTFTAKLIAFEDWATGRIFLYPVFLAKGQGVRQEHVAQALVAMAQDKRWGVPQRLYIDNGGEFLCTDLIQDAMAFQTKVRLLNDDPELRKEFHKQRKTLVRAQPYNASAKSIEPAFAALEYPVFSMLPGWIGGNRMAKKTHNVGKLPKPYPGGEAAFLQDLSNCVKAYNSHAKAGHLKGRSPVEVFNEAVEAGWKPRLIDPDEMLAAFATDATREVRQGCFTWQGHTYTAREIQQLPAGTTLNLRVSIFRDVAEIAVRNADGSLLCIAQPDHQFDIFDDHGAEESGRRRAEGRKGIAALRAKTVPLDKRAELARMAEAEGEGMLPEEGDMIRLDAGTRAVANEVFAKTPAQRRSETRAKREAELRREEIANEEQYQILKMANRKARAGE